MPRVYTSCSDPIDFCKRHFPGEKLALKRYGNLGDGPDGRGNCFGWNAAHPAYGDEDYKCETCGCQQQEWRMKMKIKLLEVRDRATFIPVMAILNVAENVAQRRLLRSAGFGEPYDLVTFTYLKARGPAHYDFYDWPDNPRTMRVAHEWVYANWDQLSDGDVVDVEFILGETTEKKTAEAGMM